MAPAHQQPNQQQQQPQPIPVILELIKNYFFIYFKII
jgi:hypothetical protein